MALGLTEQYSLPNDEFIPMMTGWLARLGVKGCQALMECKNPGLVNPHLASLDGARIGSVLEQASRE